MTDKQKQIEEMAKTINDVLSAISHCPFDVKCPYLYKGNDIDCDECMMENTMYEAGYRKIPEGSIVVTKEYYDDMCADVNEYEERLLARLTDVIERCQKRLKSVLEKVWDNATTNDEVGARWILLQIAKEEGVKIDRELKKYGKNAIK